MARNYGSYRRAVKDLKSIQGKSERVISRLMSDARSRIPGWVASEVTQVYNVKKSEIVPAKTGKSKKTVGSIKVTGQTVDGLEIVYKGRPLSPTHFGMTPKIPRESYTLKAEIIKGSKKVLGKKKKLTKKQRAALGKNFRRQGGRTSEKSPIMLMYTGNTKENGVNYIPFQRQSPRRGDIKAIKTVSLPQMVSSERTRDNIDRAINDGLQKRLAQHMRMLQR